MTRFASLVARAAAVLVLAGSLAAQDAPEEGLRIFFDSGSA